MGVNGDEEHVPFLHKDDSAEKTSSSGGRPSTRARRIEILRHSAHWAAHLLLIFLLFMLFETQVLKIQPLRPFLRPAESESDSDRHSLRSGNVSSSGLQRCPFNSGVRDEGHGTSRSDRIAEG